MEGPHRIVDSVADGVVDAVVGVADGLGRTIRSVGKTVMSALDKLPLAQLTGKEGPHRAIDRLADGGFDSAKNFVEVGIIGTVRIAGKGVMKALDHPIEQIGLLEGKLPKFWKK